MTGLISSIDHLASSPGSDRILLVMLPGAGITAEEFGQRGLVSAIQSGGRIVDVIAAGPELGLYLDGDFAAALHETIIEPALAKGYSRLWLLGISLGGMGALLYASRHAALLEGLILLAPFLGTQGTIAEISASGGLLAWSATASSATQGEQRILTWLQSFLAGAQNSPAIYLGYGSNDRFATGHRLLAAALPASRVVTLPGGHDWDTWLPLCRRVVDIMPFDMKLSGVP